MASKVTFKISLSDLVDDIHLMALTQSTKKEILGELSDFVLDKIIEDTSNQTSAVSGQRWKGLKKDSAYYKEKSKITMPIANLDLFGDMLSALKGRVLNDDEVEIGIFKKAEAQKADGHCHTLVFGENKNLPVRQFLPADGEELRSGIMREVVSLARQLVDDAPKKKGLSKEELTALAMEISNGG